MDTPDNTISTTSNQSKSSFVTPSNCINISKYPFESVSANQAILDKACTSLHKGSLVAVPTDTLYGIAGDLFNEKSIQAIYSLKSRDQSKPLALSIGSLDDLSYFCHSEHLEKEFLSFFLPGPYTLVLKTKESIPSYFNPGLSSVGVRIPPCKFIQDLCKSMTSETIVNGKKIVHPGCIALTSANLSTQPSTISVEEFSHLHNRFSWIFDAGKLPKSRLGSTVVDLSNDKVFKIFRPGPTVDEMKVFLQKKGWSEKS